MKFVLDLLLLLLLTHSAYAQVILRFQPQITTEAQTIGDLLIIKKDSHNWAKITLDSHPQALEIVTKQAIISWMESTVGKQDWQWEGKTHIQVKPLPVVSPKSLIQKAELTLSNELKKHYTHFTLKALNKPQGNFPAQEYIPQFSLDYPVSKRLVVKLKHPQQKTIAIWFAIKAYDKVLVAKEDLKTRTQIKPSDFIWKERNIAGQKNLPCKQLPQTAWLTSNLGKNQLLLRNSLSKRPQILQGETIKIQVQNQKIHLTTTAVAQNDGYTGQKIRVQNPQTRQFFIATVSGPHQAVISL